MEMIIIGDGKLMNAARKGDWCVCPKVKGSTPHLGGEIISGSQTVSINGKPAARKGDKVSCMCGETHKIKAGCSRHVFIDGKPAAVKGSIIEGYGKIIQGSDDTLIGLGAEPITVTMEIINRALDEYPKAITEDNQGSVFNELLGEIFLEQVISEYQYIPYIGFTRRAHNADYQGIKAADEAKMTAVNEEGEVITTGYGLVEIETKATRTYQERIQLSRVKVGNKKVSQLSYANNEKRAQLVLNKYKKEQEARKKGKVSKTEDNIGGKTTEEEVALAKAIIGKGGQKTLQSCFVNGLTGIGEVLIHSSTGRRIQIKGAFVMENLQTVLSEIQNKIDSTIANNPTNSVVNVTTTTI